LVIIDNAASAYIPVYTQPTVTMTNSKPLIPTEGAPDATAARAYSICTSLPDGLTK